MLSDDPGAPGETGEEALRARITALEADLRELVSVAAHDLTEPLRTVTGYLELLERRYGEQLDDTGRAFIHHATDGAERMRALLEDLLRYSRLGGEGAAGAPVDVNVVLDGVLRSLGPATAEAGATVEVLAPLPTVTADPVPLGQLLQNLVANAVKFHRPGVPNRVTIGAGRDPEDAGWLLWVADDGIGIDPAHQERIFRVFERLHAREDYEGTGIGLAICRRIAERLGGTLHVRSAPGAGSTFTIALPD